MKLLLMILLIALSACQNRHPMSAIHAVQLDMVDSASLCSRDYEWLLTDEQLGILQSDLGRIQSNNGVRGPSRKGYRVDADRELVIRMKDGSVASFLYFIRGVVTSDHGDDGYVVTPIDTNKAVRIQR